MNNQLSHSVARQHGFSLMELLVAMTIFGIVAGASVSLYNKHVPLFTQQQNQTAVNIALRNVAAELQMDMANAGVGYYKTTSDTALPVGVVVNPGTGNCYNPATQTYGAGCFDTVSIISVDPNTTPAFVTDPGNGGQQAPGLACKGQQNVPSSFGGQVPNSSTLFVMPDPNSTTTVQQLAASYNAGDVVLITDGQNYVTVVLTQNGQAAGANGVKLNHNPSAGGKYTNSVNQAQYLDDYYNLNYAISNNNANNGAFFGSNKIGTSFCDTAWVFKVSATTYGVDLSNPNDPTLVRSVNNGHPQVIADQIIGFKVGVWALDNVAQAQGQPVPSQTPGWYYDTTTYDLNTVQGVRISVVGRTNPSTGYAAGFRNTLDNGRYKIEAASIVVDPRNLSMNK